MESSCEQNKLTIKIPHFSNSTRFFVRGFRVGQELIYLGKVVGG